MEGALAGIRSAREQKVPFVGTCGGVQHVVLEFARNVLGFRDAVHTESEPNASKAKF
jgi:CTP synthase (UTP-ammonia lyase)